MKKKPTTIRDAVETISNISIISAHHAQLFSMNLSSFDYEEQQKIIKNLEKNLRAICDISHLVIEKLGLNDGSEMKQYLEDMAEKETVAILSRLNKK